MLSNHVYTVLLKILARPGTARIKDKTAGVTRHGTKKLHSNTICQGTVEKKNWQATVRYGSCRIWRGTVRHGFRNDTICYDTVRY